MKKQPAFKLLLGIILCCCMACNELSDNEIYQRPEWLPGKLYTTVKAQENLSMFAECLQQAGLDTILDISGSWSVFAPTNEAIEQYLSENNFASIADIPPGELERLAEYHVIQNPWSLEQLQSLSAFGWRIGNNRNIDSYAYKRQTMFKNQVEKYWIKKVNREEVIVLDSANADRSKRVYVESRKYVPLFYDDYLLNNDITSEDYRFYFDRPYENGNVYYAGAKILQSDLLAENGFLHVIDRVIDPMMNAKEILDRDKTAETYKLFLEMACWYYPGFEPNMEATYNQPEVRLGGLVDTLWNLHYSRLAFALHKESTGFEGSNINETLVRHNGMVAFTDNALRKFIDEILTVKSGYPHWRDHLSLPIDIVDIIVARHLKANPIYPSSESYSEIFNNENGASQDEESIIKREFGSNCTFIGLDNYIPDRVFTSVTGPVFCRPNYSMFRLAMQYSGADDIIANHPGELYFFPIPDYALRSDSSLILNWIDKDQNWYNFRALDRKRHSIVNINQGTLRSWILNQVGTPIPNNGGDKQLIRTLTGKTITWDLTTNTIQGRLPSTFGYNSYDVRTCTTSLPFEEPTSNGMVWSVDYWFNF